MTDSEIETEFSTQKRIGWGLGLVISVCLIMWWTGVIKLYGPGDYLTERADTRDRYEMLVSELRQARVEMIRPADDLGRDYVVEGLGSPLVVRVRDAMVADHMVQVPLFKIEISESGSRVRLHDSEDTQTSELSGLLLQILERVNQEVGRA
tara:strand:+ start:1960 stop:2412 length:453 start_codon:yes stop_codon:yes gene_type:complete